MALKDKLAMPPVEDDEMKLPADVEAAPEEAPEPEYSPEVEEARKLLEDEGWQVVPPQEEAEAPEEDAEMAPPPSLPL